MTSSFLLSKLYKILNDIKLTLTIILYNILFIKIDLTDYNNDDYLGFIVLVTFKIGFYIY